MGYPTKETDWEELIADYWRFRGPIHMLARYHVPINSDEELKERVGLTADRMNQLGWDARFSEIVFAKLPEGVGGTGDEKTGKIKISERKRGSTDPFIHNTIPHEIMHTSGVGAGAKNEITAELHAMEADLRIGNLGELEFAAAAYTGLSNWVDKSLELKVRREGLPEKYRKEVEDIIGAPTKKRWLKRTYKLDYKRSKCVKQNDESLYRYGLGPYLAIKAALHNPGSKIDTTFGPLDVSATLEAFTEDYWKSPEGGQINRLEKASD